MSMKGPASLTGSLIVTKGNAAPAGLLAMNRKRASLRPDAAVTAPKPVPAARNPDISRGQARRSRLTLRLDPGRHLKIKLAAAHLNLSLQEIMVSALDNYLAEIQPSILGGACNCLAAPVPKSAAAKNHSGG